MFINLRGYSLIGKTAILHIVILGSSPNVSNIKIQYSFLKKQFIENTIQRLYRKKKDCILE